jgi:TonB family protein
MESMLFYLLRASVYLVVFSLVYYLLLSKHNATLFNRIYILCSFALSVVLAAVKPFMLATGQSGQDGIFLTTLPEFVFQAGAQATENISRMPGMVFYLPWVLAVICMLILAKRLVVIYNYLVNHPHERLGDVELVLVDKNHSPFSFFRWIFIPVDLRLSEHFQKVIDHEKAHYLKGHSWDILFMEVMRLLFWFHPFFYYLKRELQTLHEYEADAYALQRYDRSDYQRALLDFALGAQYLPVTNPFNVSTIKKRFIMMSTSKIANLRQQWLRAFVVIPAVLLIFALQSFIQPPASPPPPPVPAEEEAKMNKALQEIVVVGHDNSVFTEVETEPEYAGGQMELMKHLQANLRYPTAAREAGKQGTVFASFIIEKDGSITDIKIIRGVSAELDAEATRVIKLMPAWVPGKLNGETVRVQFTMPIRFVLN